MRRCRTTGNHRNTSGLKPRWKKGQSGNPKGRPPRKLSITEALRDAGEANDAARFVELAEVIWQAAVRGEAWACNFVADRLEGRPIQSVRDVSEPDGETVINIGGQRLSVNPNARPVEL